MSFDVTEGIRPLALIVGLSWGLGSFFLVYWLSGSGVWGLVVAGVVGVGAVRAGLLEEGVEF